MKDWDSTPASPVLLFAPIRIQVSVSIPQFYFDPRTSVSILAIPDPRPSVLIRSKGLVFESWRFASIRVNSRLKSLGLAFPITAMSAITAILAALCRCTLEQKNSSQENQAIALLNLTKLLFWN